MAIPDADKQHWEISVLGRMTAGGGNAVLTANVFHYRRNLFPAPAVKSEIEAAFEALVVAPILLLLNARWTHTQTTVRCLNDALDPPVVFAHTDPGNVAGDSLQSDQAAYLLVRTGTRGRSFRGSKHFGPMSETDVTTNGDVWNAAALTRIGDVATAMVANLTDASGNVYVPGVLSRKLSQLRENPTFVSQEDMLQILTNHRVGNMKRRQVKSVY